MNDIRFDMTYLQLTWDTCVQAETKVEESVQGFAAVAQKMDNELASFQADAQKAAGKIRDAIRQVNGRIRSLSQKSDAALAGKQEPLRQPPQPSIPENATAEQKNAIAARYREEVRRIEKKNKEIRQKNEQIDTYCANCANASQELEQIISRLQQLEVARKQEADTAVEVVHNFQYHSRDILAQGDRVNTAMKQFTRAFYRAYEDAQKLFLLEPRKLRSTLYTDKLFEIRNTHSHAPAGQGASLGNRPGRRREICTEESDELLLRDRDGDSFLQKAAQVNRIKMPSANLHRLGSQAFCQEMEQLGYRMVTQSDGAAIDANGMIHWERTHG